MSTYAQLGPKRQRVNKETRVSDVDYFQGIEKAEFNSTSPSDTGHYRYYSATERINSRTMDEWLKLSVSLTEFRSLGSDVMGRPTYQRQWDDHTSSLDNYKRAIRACFDFCLKLGVKYFTAFDSDLVPPSDGWEENRSNWEEIVEYVQEHVQRTHVRPLWVAADLHSQPRYASGAITNHDASSFITAATQIKKCLEISQRLNCECFLIWPYREGYDAIFKCDVTREVKLFAKLLKMTSEYKERLNYRCQMLIMPYYGSSRSCERGASIKGTISDKLLAHRLTEPALPDFLSRLLRHAQEEMQLMHSFYRSGSAWDSSRANKSRDVDMIHRYMWDVTSCMYFLKHFNLDRHYKACVPPGHHMFMANVYNVLGGVVISRERNQYDDRKLTLMMKCIVDQGATPPAGITLALSPRRDSTELRDLVTTYILYIDAVARGLRKACSIVAEQTFSKHVQQKYSSYYSGYGARLTSGDISMEECEEHYKKHQQQLPEQPSSRSEHLDVIFHRHLDSPDQM